MFFAAALILHPGKEEAPMRPLAVLSLSAVVAGCATLGQFSAFVQPPRFEEARDHSIEFRVVPPSAGRVLGGANIRLWTKVTNPNPFGFTLARLSGTLFLDDARATTADFPLGLPLSAGGEAVIPIDVSVDFSELPQLAAVARQAFARQRIDYRFDGTIGVDAGRLGTPVFGPLTFVRGAIN